MVIHPLMLHFPVALLFTGTIALAVGLIRPGLFRKRPTSQAAFEGFVNGVLSLGYAGLVLTIITGLFDMQASPKTQAREGWIVIAVIHIISGVTLLVIYGSLLYRRFVILPPTPQPAAPGEPDSTANPAQTESHHPDWLSLFLAGLGLVILVMVGWLGGMLVYEYRVGIG